MSLLARLSTRLQDNDTSRETVEEDNYVLRECEEGGVAPHEKQLP